MPDQTQILLVDDHALFREAIAGMLSAQSDFAVAGEAASIEEGLEVINVRPVDLVLLDIDLGAENGQAFLRRARSAGFEGKILVVTAGVNKIEATRLLESGCVGILLKHERPKLLIERIREVVRGSFGAQPESIEIKDISPKPRRPLTPRERQVLRGVFEGRSNKEIASDLGVSESMVKALLQQLFRKTEVRSRGQLVRAAMERYWNEIDEF
jgi:two-component system nitrate/nitrite response regulator NarL